MDPTFFDTTTERGACGLFKVFAGKNEKMGCQWLENVGHW
jgi:hypothetical protein